MTRGKAISVCRADEKSKRQIQKMNEGEHGNEVHAVKKKTNLEDSQEVRDLKKKRSINFSVINVELIMKEKRCPAYGNIRGLVKNN